MISELTTVIRARQFCQSAEVISVPVDIAKFARAAGAELRTAFDMAEHEAGETIPLGDRHIIHVNGNHSAERQRFTALHEIAHIVLTLASKHTDGLDVATLTGYAARPAEEILCDVFAAECLLPYKFFVGDVAKREPGMDAVKDLAERYQASMTSTASRFATACKEPCTMVLAEDGIIRYAGSSASMRELGLWVERGVPIPNRSVTARCLTKSDNEGDDCVPAYLWSSSDRVSDLKLCEEVIVLKRLNQSVTLLWVEEIAHRTGRHLPTDTDDELLPELDGVLPWPSKSRRR